MQKIIERIKESCGYKTESAIAKALGMSPQNFNSQKKSGGIKDSLILHAIDKGVSKEWILTGNGEMFVSKKEVVKVDEWKDKYIVCMEELNETLKENQRLKERLDRLTAPPTVKPLVAGSENGGT